MFFGFSSERGSALNGRRATNNATSANALKNEILTFYQGICILGGFRNLTDVRAANNATSVNTLKIENCTMVDF